MPLKLGTVTVIAGNGNEAASVDTFSYLPWGAWLAFRSWLLDRILRGDNIVIREPFGDEVTAWYKDIREEEYGTLHVRATLNGCTGTVSFHYSNGKYTVSSHT